MLLIFNHFFYGFTRIKQAAKGEEEPKTGEAKCGDGIAEEECMIRKTQEAHLDYIYTQDQKPRP